MASNWRIDCTLFGLAPFWENVGGIVLFDLIAHSLDFPGRYIAKGTNGLGSIGPILVHPPGTVFPDTYAYQVLLAGAPHFPYGYAVSPD